MKRTDILESNHYIYQQIYSDLKSQIVSRQIECGSLIPSENTIAQQYNVNRSTVRKALQMLVDEGLAEKQPGRGCVVLDQNAVKKAVPEAETPAAVFPYRNIGFLLPSGNAITQTFYSMLFYVLERELKRFNFSLIYSTFNEHDDLAQTVADYNLSGIIFVSNVSPRQIGAALEMHIPCTLVNSYDARVPSVLSDNVNGAYLAGKYLLECGHSNVLIASGVRSYICSEERIIGFRRAFEEAGIRIPSDHILEADSWEQESGVNVVQQYLSSCKTLPTAIFGLNDRLAFGAMQAVRQCGFKVPEDISVIGYDNLNSQLFPLTTIETHVEDIAEAAAQAQLWQNMGGRLIPCRINIPTALVKGETVRFL